MKRLKDLIPWIGVVVVLLLLKADQAPAPPFTWPWAPNTFYGTMTGAARARVAYYVPGITANHKAIVTIDYTTGNYDDSNGANPDTPSASDRNISAYCKADSIIVNVSGSGDNTQENETYTFWAFDGSASNAISVTGTIPS